jgi:hypothetical protein
MTTGPRIVLLIGLACLVPALSVRAEQGTTPSSGSRDPVILSNPWISGANLATPPDLPEIGKWMLGSDGAAAHWLGERFRGKGLREPINVVIVDEAARDAAEATARVLAAAQAAGYPVRMGHSTGYGAVIGGQLYAQLPRGRDDAFSNDPFEISNNHGRVFGPHQAGGAFVFIAAFSREEVDPFRSPGHRYASFNRARDDFTQRLDGATPFKVSGFVPLDNAIIGDPAVTTGDHDGVAVLVRAGK